MDAYLDIETTGLDPQQHELTVVGISVGGASNREVVQLYEASLTPEALERALAGVETIFTYNGSQFDLPFITARLGFGFEGGFTHHDLMHDCHARGLYGGLKRVEQRLGIARQMRGVGGAEAVRLWGQYKAGDAQALTTLLAYNREDVLNLKALRGRLAGQPA